MLLINKKYESLYNILESNIKSEGTLHGTGANSDYTKHNFKYAINVINILLNDGKLYLGKSGKDGEVPSSPLSNEVKDNLRNLLDNIQNTTVDDFNNAVSSAGFRWTNIFKSAEIRGEKSTKLSSKELSPQKLGITGTFNKSSLLKSIKEGLTSSADNNVITNELAKSLIFICTQIDKGTEEKVTIDELLAEGAKTVLTYDLPKSKVDSDALVNSLDAITKDFGEIIGGVFLLNYMKGANAVIYNAGMSDAMIDYSILTDDGANIGISAKASSGGNAPSIAPAMRALKDFVISDVEINDTGLTFTELLNKSYVDDAPSAARARELFEFLEATTDMSTKEQLIKLVELYCSNNKAVKDICKLFDLNKFSDLLIGGPRALETNFSQKFDAVCNDSKKFNKLLSIKNSIKENCNGRDTDISFSSPEEALKLSSLQKIGWFLVPLVKAAIDLINNEFGLDKNNKDKVDIISAFIRLAFSHKQIYTKIAVSSDASLVKIIFSFAAMNTGNWRFKTKAMGNNPWKGGLTMEIVH